MGDDMDSHDIDDSLEGAEATDLDAPVGDGSGRRKKLLVQTVGTGPKVHESLIKTIAEHKPDLVIQLCTHGSFVREDSTAKEEPRAASASTIDAFDEAWTGRSACDIVRIAYYIDEPQREAVEGRASRALPANPNLLQELMRGFDVAIRDAVKELGDCEVLLDFTSGTKAMSAALVAVGRDLGADSFLYVSGPRDPESGRVVESQTVESVARAPLTLGVRIEQLLVLFANHRFSAIEREAENLIAVAKEQRNHHRQSQIEAIRDLAKICDQWERFQWEQANASLHGMSEKRRRKIDAAGWPAQELERWREHASRVVKSETGVDRLIDLLANARRRLQDGAHDDAVARCYRLCEYIAQVRLGERHLGMGTKLLSELSREQWSSLPASATTLIERDYLRLETDGTPQRGPLRLGLHAIHRVLEACGDEYARRFMDDYGRDYSKLGDLGDLLKKRNKSFLAHGSRPVDHDTASKLLAWCVTLLARHVDSTPEEIRRRITAAAFPRHSMTVRLSGNPS